MTDISVKGSASPRALVTVLTDAIETSDRRGRWRSYMLPVVACWTAAASWFKPGTFIAAGDVGPFYQDGLRHEVWDLWNHRVTGAGSTSADIARLPLVVVSSMTAALGGTDLVAQRVFYLIVVALAAIGAAHLARAFAVGPWVAAAAGVLAVVNPLVLVSLPNPLVPLAIGVGGLLAGELIRAGGGARVPGWRIGLLSLGSAYLSVNPPTLGVTAVFVISAALSARWLVGPGATARACRTLGRATPWVLVCNLWWLVPFVLATFLMPAGTAVAAQTNPDAWAWSQVANSIPNVITLKAQWGWTRPEYYPYAIETDAAPWGWMVWALPLLAAAAPFVNRGRRRAAVALLGATVVLLFIAKGLHNPFRGANAALYAHVPGFWLLREPMSKVGLVLVLLYVVLAAFTLEGARALATRIPAPRSWAQPVALLALAAAVVYPGRALWSGAVIADDRAPLPGTHVTVPAEWTDVLRALDHAPAGKVLVLPIDGFYQVTTNWGYHGVDDLVRARTTRPVVQRLPGGYFSDLPGFDGIITATERALAEGDSERAQRLLDALGVSTVILRHDMVAGSGDAPFTDPGVLAPTLDRTPGLSRSLSTSVADLYVASDAAPTVRVASDATAVIGSDPVRRALTRATLPPGEVAVDASAPVDRVVATLGGGTRSTDFELAQGGSYRVRITPEQQPLWRATLTPDDGSDHAALQLATAAQITVDGVAVEQPQSSTIAGLPQDVAAIDDGASVFMLNHRDDVVALPAGRPIDVLHRVGGDLIDHQPSPVADCSAYDGRDMTQTGIDASELNSGTVRVTANAHSGCVNLSAANVRPGLYQLSVTARSTSGRPARVCVWEDGPNRCAASADVPSREWANVTVPVTIDADTTSVRTYLYADGADDGVTTTVADYQGVTLERLVPAATVTLPSAGTRTRDVPLDAGRHRLGIASPENPNLLGHPSNLEDCAASDRRGLNQIGSTLDLLPDGTIKLSATTHSSCVWMPVYSADLARSYHVHFRYRTASGLAARFCLWQIGVNRCAPMPPLQQQQGERVYDADIVSEPGTTGLRLFVYADGAEPRTTTTYSDMRLELTDLSTVALAPVADDRAAPPAITVRGHGTDRYDVELASAARPFVLVLNESSAADWHLAGLPGGATARHVEADGYANAWLITPSPTQPVSSLSITYRPQALARAASQVSAIGISLALAAPLVGRIRRSPRRHAARRDRARR